MAIKKSALIVLIFITLSCTSLKDVTFDPSFNFGYEKGNIYQNLTDMYIIDDKDPYLVLPGEIYPPIPKYMNNRKNFKDIKGILEKESKMIIERLLYRSKFEGSYLDVFARIIDGEHTGDRVRLNIVSIIEFKPYPDGGAVPAPDPNLMKLIKK